MNYVSKILRLKIYCDKYFSLKWNILAESLSYADCWHKEASCAYADAEIWVYIINDLSCHGELRLVLKAIPCHKSTFYNVQTQGTLYMHSKLITEAAATFEISIPLFILKHEILHPKFYYSLKFIQNVISYQLDSEWCVYQN